MRKLRNLTNTGDWTQILAGMSWLGVTTEDQLIPILTDSNRRLEERALACSLLGLKHARCAVSALLGIGVTASDPLLEWECFRALGLIGSRRSTRPLLRQLRKSVPAQKKRAIVFALGLLHDERSRTVLLGRLLDQDEDPKVRGFAAEALGMLRPTTRTVKELIHSLSDNLTEVRYSALCAVESLRVKEAVSAVAKLLSDHTVADGQTTVANRAADVLALLRSQNGAGASTKRQHPRLPSRT